LTLFFWGNRPPTAPGVTGRRVKMTFNFLCVLASIGLLGYILFSEFDEVQEKLDRIENQLKKLNGEKIDDPS
jgi:hypothetical protein